LGLGAYLVVNNSDLDLIHEFRHNLGILTAFHVTSALDVARYVPELVFDSFQGTKEDSMLNPTKRGRCN